eukprot:CAMPEP_0118923074 /NCGR_PEP_ID=MMETSP1169-20130426/1739_1 /TAXON_ID=36882 /ORGANISM="Pyramimonas obovata, Strain CCMP722" /LENGTH=200 /DNA_ID=CAMNT_0006864015 /DNA_START=296 /DNA_END=898 /DNA_ORIENTATION=+
MPTGPVKPPSLFPEHEDLPPLPQISEREQHLLLRRRQLISAYRGSPYFIEAKLEEKEVDVSRYSDRYTRKQTTTSRPPLNSVMTLTPINFPSELYGKGGKGRGKNVLSGLSNVNKASEDLLKLEELAKLEKRYADEEAKEAGGGKDGEGKSTEAGEGEEPEEEEMEEEEYEDDDYMQGYDFDDDDGYDDDGGGDDDEAVF